eukprot:scaffold131573_cov21-Tisochrysis_lutea.AAC.1
MHAAVIMHPACSNRYAECTQQCMQLYIQHCEQQCMQQCHNRSSAPSNVHSNACSNACSNVRNNVALLIHSQDCMYHHGMLKGCRECRVPLLNGVITEAFSQLAAVRAGFANFQRRKRRFPNLSLLLAHVLANFCICGNMSNIYVA